MNDDETQQPEPAEAPTPPVEGSVPSTETTAHAAAEPSAPLPSAAVPPAPVPPIAAPPTAAPPAPAPLPSEPEPVIAPPTTTASGLPNPYGLPDVAVDRPEIAVGAAFGGGLVLAMILKRLVR